MPLTLPTILGRDVAGEVVEVGDGVTEFAPGDRVMDTPDNRKPIPPGGETTNQIGMVHPSLNQVGLAGAQKRGQPCEEARVGQAPAAI